MGCAAGDPWAEGQTALQVHSSLASGRCGKMTETRSGKTRLKKTARTTTAARGICACISDALSCSFVHGDEARDVGFFIVVAC